MGENAKQPMDMVMKMGDLRGAVEVALSTVERKIFEAAVDSASDKGYQNERFQHVESALWTDECSPLSQIR